MKLKFIIIFLTIGLYSCKSDKKTTPEKTPTTTVLNIENGNYCFESVVENTIKKDDKTSVEKDFLNVNLHIADTNATGTYSFKPNKGKAQIGSFTGTIKDDVITSIYTYQHNGNSLKEEIVFKIEPNQISLLGGEKELKDGVSYFKNKSNGVFMMQIPKVACK